MKQYELVIIGGGPAGLACAVKAYDAGARSIVILERDGGLGGILQQCIHNGFGLTRFKENMTGPEYADRFISAVQERNIPVILNTMVMNVTKQKVVTAVNSTDGIFTINAKAIILAMGCRERSRGALNIAGSRPAGVFSAGTAQKYVNIKGYMPGRRVVILGSGDIGLIMARRMTLEGATVLAVCEIMPHSSGLRRNIVQCLDDYNIPLYLEHTIINIKGEKRVQGVTIAKVDGNKKPILGTEISFDCDTVLFSVGLIPENELSLKAGIQLSNSTKGAVVNQFRETDVQGIFACGNVLHVHDLVDFVSEEAEIAGLAAAKYLADGEKASNNITSCPGENVSYVLPQIINKNDDSALKLYFRVNKAIRNVKIVVSCGEKILLSKKSIAVTPGEMESVILKPETISSANEQIRVSVVEL